MDIEKLSLEQLIELHCKISKRIRELRKMKLFEDLQNFEVGDRVSFRNKENIITGTVVRINQKSLTIKTKEGTWYVDPRLVTKLNLSHEENDKNISGGIQQLKWSKN